MCLGSPRTPALRRKDAQSATLADAYTYDLGSTATVDHVSRVAGTTAGGTTVTIYGEGFGTDPEVHLGGIKCATERDDIGSYRGRHLCDWGEVQSAKGQDIAVDCTGLGTALRLNAWRARRSSAVRLTSPCGCRRLAVLTRASATARPTPGAHTRLETR